MEYQNLTLKQIYFEAEVIAGDAKAHFDHLNSRQLNWKPADDSWSFAQCLDHLISINGEYYPTFNRILNGGELSASLILLANSKSSNFIGFRSEHLGRPTK